MLLYHINIWNIPIRVARYMKLSFVLDLTVTRVFSKYFELGHHSTGESCVCRFQYSNWWCAKYTYPIEMKQPANSDSYLATCPEIKIMLFVGAYITLGKQIQLRCFNIVS